MGFWNKKSGKTTQTEEKPFHITEISNGISILVKKSFMEPKLAEYSERLSAECTKDSIPNTGLSISERDEFIVMVTLSFAKLDEKMASYAQVKELSDCTTIYDQDIGSQWEVPGYWIAIPKA